MGKTSYQSISALVKELEAQLKKLNQGNLPLNEIEGLVDHAREIYERLIAVRYKAYENLGEPSPKKEQGGSAIPLDLTIDLPEEKPAPVAKAVTETPELKSFDFTPFEDDSAKKVPEPKIAKPISSIAKDFDFSEDAFEAPKTDEPTVTKEVKKPIDKVRAEIKSESLPLHEKFLKDEGALNEKLKQEEPLPLRKKLQSKGIPDLRKEIGIGKKFEYINFLFGGDARAYEAGIDALNATQTREEAKEKLHELGTTYGWNLEEKTIIKFIELVERKFH